MPPRFHLALRDARSEPGQALPHQGVSVVRQEVAMCEHDAFERPREQPVDAGTGAFTVPIGHSQQRMPSDPARSRYSVQMAEELASSNPIMFVSQTFKIVPSILSNEYKPPGLTKRDTLRRKRLSKRIEEAMPLFLQASRFLLQSPHLRVGVCRGHPRVCQPAYVNPQLTCWRACCAVFAR